MWARIENDSVVEIIQSPKQIVAVMQVTRQVEHQETREREIEREIPRGIEGSDPPAFETVIETVTETYEETVLVDVLVDVGVTHTAAIFTAWSASDLTAIGIIPARYDDTAPSVYHTATAGAWAIIDGEAVGTRTWEQPALSASDLKAYAADLRWLKETSGVVVGGIPIPTDDRAKVLLLGAAMSMTDEQTAQYVVGSVSITLTGAQFKGLYAGLVAHVQECFATQTAVLTEIDAGTITTRAEIDAAFA